MEISDTDGISYVLTIRMFKYKDLDSIAKSKVLSESDIIKIGMDVCNALEACERKGIMHRDIKPGNIFYAEDKDKGKYLLADFGISRIVEKGDLAHTYQGTWQFAAPEQFDGLTGRNGYDHRVDIYSLGLTLYYLANNQKFPSCNRYREEIAPIEGVNPELNRILLKACALSAGNRYSEASEMKTDLQILYQAVGKKKGTKRVSQFDSQRYETESAKPEIKNLCDGLCAAAICKSESKNQSRHFEHRKYRISQQRVRLRHQEQKSFSRRERSRQQKQKIFQRREHSKHQKQKIFQRRERSKHQKIFQPREHSEHWRQRIFQLRKRLKYREQKISRPAAETV